MKTIKTFMGVRPIEGSELGFLRIQIREILQQSRKSLIERLLAEKALEEYVLHRFDLKVTPPKAMQIRAKLQELQDSGINMARYRMVFQAALDNDNTQVDTPVFYAEIDHYIKLYLHEIQIEFDLKENFQISQINIIQNTRQMLIGKIITEKGFRNFVLGQYNIELTDVAKIQYLLQELQDYFMETQIDYQVIVDFITRQHLEIVDGAKQYFKKEVVKVLQKHFDHPQ